MLERDVPARGHLHLLLRHDLAWLLHGRLGRGGAADAEAAGEGAFAVALQKEGRGGDRQINKTRRCSSDRGWDETTRLNTRLDDVDESCHKCVYGIRARLCLVLLQGAVVKVVRQQLEAGVRAWQPALLLEEAQPVCDGQAADGVRRESQDS